MATLSGVIIDLVPGCAHIYWEPCWEHDLGNSGSGEAWAGSGRQVHRGVGRSMEEGVGHL